MPHAIILEPPWSREKRNKSEHRPSVLLVLHVFIYIYIYSQFDLPQDEDAS